MKTQAEISRCATEVAKALRSRLPANIKLMIYIGDPALPNFGALNSDIPLKQLPQHLRSLADQVEQGQ